MNDIDLWTGTINLFLIFGVVMALAITMYMKPGRFMKQKIPKNEEWLHAPGMKAKLARADEWFRDNPPSETDLDELERQLEEHQVITHVTPAGANIFLDLGFPPNEAEALLAESDRQIAEKVGIPTGQIKSFGPVGPKYEVGKPLCKLDDGDWMVEVTLVESGEKGECRLSKIHQDPAAI